MKTFALFSFLMLWAGAAWAVPGDVIRDVPAPGKTCTGLAFDGKLIWVADHTVDQLIAVDPASGAVKAGFKSPGFRPAGLAFDGQQLWNVDVLQAKIFRIRPSDGVVTRVIPALHNPSPFTYPKALAFDGKNLWVSDDDQQRIFQIDPSDGTMIRDVPFPSASVDGLAFDGTYLWTADSEAQRLYAVSTVTGDVVMSLKAPGPRPSGLGYNGKELISVDYQSDRIYFIKRNDTAFVLQEEPRQTWVVLSHQLRNYGPDPLVEFDNFVAVPKNLDSQELLAPPVFSATPTETSTDQYGQSVARFHGTELAGGQTAEVRMKVHFVAKGVRYLIYPENVKSISQVPSKVRQQYLADAIKYDIKSPAVTKAVADAVGGEKNPYWIVRRIYRYLQEKVKYERVGGWDVASKVLERGSGSCSEYSYAFIAMCRAAGIPTRYVGSLFGRKQGAFYDDIFHRWIEVYLPPYGWIPVDPSRGDKPTAAGRAEFFGRIGPTYLITTHGGGGSTLLDWSYNSNERFTCKGQCRVEFETLAEWSLDDPDADATSASPAPAPAAAPAAAQAGAQPAKCGVP